MSEIDLAFGAEVADREGPVGQLTRVVFDPADRTAHFVVIVPDYVGVTARLVPIGTIGFDPSASLLLMCSHSQFTAFEEAVKYDTLPYSPVNDALRMVIAETDRSAVGGVFLGGPTVTSHNRVPNGMVAVERLQAVDATDGHIGQISGARVDLADHRVTKLLIVEGHLWSKKPVAFPTESVTEFTDPVCLPMSIQQARAVVVPYD